MSKNDQIVARMRAFVEAMEQGNDITELFTVRTVKLNVETEPCDAKFVKEVRTLLGASQAVFAKFLGVSVNAVRDWEQGLKTPSGSSCRLIHEIKRDPKYWRQRFVELAVPVKQ